MQSNGDNSTARTSLELLYNVSRELTSALELNTVLEKVISLSMENVGALNGSIIVMDSSKTPIEGILCVGEKQINNATKQLAATLNDGLAGWVIRNQQGALLEDTSQDDRWLKRPDDEANQTGAKSAVCVPLIAHQNLVGVMTLVHPEPNSFTSAHLELIQAIADQAGVAVLNARLYEDSLRRMRVMTALAESASEITASLDLDEVLQRILTQISEALRVESVSLALVNPSGKNLTYVATSSGLNSPLIGHQIAFGSGFSGQVAAEGQGVIIADTTQDERFPLDSEKIIGSDIQAIASAPLRSQNEVIGILEAVNPVDGFFDLDALEVLTGIGSLAGTAITHARLYEQVQTTRERYLELFQDSIDPIIISDSNGKIIEANRQAELFTKVNKNELLDYGINQILSKNDEGLHFDAAAMNPGEIKTFEADISPNNLKSIPVIVNLRSVAVEDGTNYQWLIRDISERKKMDRLRDDLISMIYHDLRSPLSNIVSSLDVFDAMLPKEGDPAFRSLLNIALRSTERIQRLTNSLLDMSRLESGQPVVQRISSSPVALAVDAIDAVSPVAETKNQAITLKLPGDSPTLMIDADMIHRVLINLLENAVKYSPPDGEIILGAEFDEQETKIWIQDSGPGISASEQEFIFDKFTRLNPEGDQKGFGLGLAYCRLAIEGHGGRIWVESEPNQGSRFTFTLPHSSPD
ncbi:MAG: GAF domain-containing protein [Anaerolineales bacterium]|nr:GAF domain-containing protein [Anaerolineales bacterium]